MYFIYVLFYNHPPPSFPPTVYLLQPGLTHVVHSKLPGFMPIPAMYKIKIKTVHSSVLHKHLPSPENTFTDKNTGQKKQKII